MRSLVMAIGISIMVLTGSLWAQGPMMGGDPEGPITEIPFIPPGKWWRIPEIVDQLKLTPQEQTQLEDMFVRSQRKIIELRGAWAKEKFELEQLLDKSDIDEATCMNQFKKLFEKRTEIVTERFRHVLEVKKLLGHDRFQQLKAHIQAQREMRIKEMKEKRESPEKLTPQPPMPIKPEPSPSK